MCHSPSVFIFFCPKAPLLPGRHAGRPLPINVRFSRRGDPAWSPDYRGGKITRSVEGDAPYLGNALHHCRERRPRRSEIYQLIMPSSSQKLRCCRAANNEYAAHELHGEQYFVEEQHGEEYGGKGLYVAEDGHGLNGQPAH